MKYLKSGSILLLSLLGITAQAAESINNISKGQLHFALAVGYGGIENPRAKSDNITTYALPNWSYYDERFYVENFTLGYSLYESDRFQIDLQTQLNEDGIFFKYDGWNKVFFSDIITYSPRKLPISNSKNQVPEVAIERHLSYLGGLRAAWLTPYIDINLGYYHDISGVHQGNEIHFKLRKSLGLKWGALAFELGAIRKSNNLVSYYYQFKPEELAGTRFSIKDHHSDAINYHSSAVVNLPLWRDINFVSIVTYTWLGNGISDKLMIEKDSYLSGFIGVSYAF